MAEEIKLRVAKASPKDVDQMREFLFALEEKVNDSSVDLEDIGKFCHARFNSDCGRHFQRVLFGFDTLVENACDPSLSYLEWKPEIKEALTVANNACTRLETGATNADSESNPAVSSGLRKPLGGSSPSRRE